MAKKPNLSNLPDPSKLPPDEDEENQTQDQTNPPAPMNSGESAEDPAEMSGESTENPPVNPMQPQVVGPYGMVWPRPEIVIPEPKPIPPEQEMAITLDLSLVINEANYRKRHLNMVRLTPLQAKALAAVQLAADREQATLANGARVVSAPDALRYLLERIGSEIERTGSDSEKASA